MRSPAFARSAGAAALLLLAAPAGASAAPTLDPIKPCYVSITTREHSKTVILREKLPLAGSGFAPNALVDVALDGKVIRAGVLTDAGGNLPTQTIEAPYRSKGERPFSVAVTERANPAAGATLAAGVTALNVGAQPRNARPSQVVTFRGRGFTGPGNVYGHYVFRGKERKTVTLAQRSGACGTFAVRRRQLPVRHPHVGTWTLQVDQQRTYSPNPQSVFVDVDITLRRVVRLAALAARGR